LREGIMGKILYGNELKNFISEYKLDCTSIILTIDDKRKEASYIIDGKKKIKGNYEQIRKYFQNI
jgi:hypothetical protein